jgi:hypothetical protein
MSESGSLRIAGFMAALGDRYGLERERGRGGLVPGA